MSYADAGIPSASDVRRWAGEGRRDILGRVVSVGRGPARHLDWDACAGLYGRRCPWLRKDKGLPTYRCRIHETKPEMCATYPKEGEGCLREQGKGTLP